MFSFFFFFDSDNAFFPFLHVSPESGAVLGYTNCKLVKFRGARSTGTSTLRCAEAKQRQLRDKTSHCDIIADNNHFLR